MKTIEKGLLVDVHECEVCGARSIYPDRIAKCGEEHIKEHHIEEAMVGLQ